MAQKMNFNTESFIYKESLPYDRFLLLLNTMALKLSLFISTNVIIFFSKKKIFFLCKKEKIKLKMLNLNKKYFSLKKIFNAKSL